MARKRYSGNKYGSKKVEVNGIVFDSKKEAKRYQELLLLEKAGAIQNLQRQVKYVLITAQREFTNEIYTKGRKKGHFKQGKLLERECSYIADFVYYDNNLKKIIVEDTKGVKTKEYILKRKLLLYMFNIKIHEI